MYSLALIFKRPINFTRNTTTPTMEERPNARPEINFYQWDEYILDLAIGSQAILKVVVNSKENGNTIGVKSSALGEGFLITAVEDIILEDGETYILFKPFDVTGFILPTNKLRLAEIDAACPLISEFQNPVLRNIEKDKSWFF
jgi:hypothetical protein